MEFRKLPLGLAAGFALIVASPIAAANTPEQIFAQVSPSVVVVDIVDATGKSIGLGSGIVIGAGQVITNCHVAQKGNSLQVRQASKIFKATLQFADPDRDLCQLSAPDLQVPPIALGTAKKLRVGQRVYAIGAPQGLELTLSEGLVSSLRPYEGSQYIQTSAAISPGSSGGGLFDDQGRLIGITTFYLAEGQNLNFALPVDWIGELPKRTQVKPVAKNGLDWLNQTTALEQKKDWRGMLKLSQQWVKSEPENVVALITMGVAYGRIKQYDQEIYAYWEALRIQPEIALAWHNLGIAYQEIKQYDEAIHAFQEALRIQPEDVVAWTYLGVVYEELKQYDQAIHAYYEALRIQPEDAYVCFFLGSSYIELNQYDEAINAFQEALRILPERASAWFGLGTAYYFEGKHNKVQEIYPTLRKLDPTMADKYFNAFMVDSVAAKKGEMDWASRWFALSEKKDLQGLLRLSKEWTKNEPENAVAWYCLGNTYTKLKQYNQAINAYRESLRIKPQEAWTAIQQELADALYNVGNAYNVLKKYDLAVQAFRETLRILPERATAWFGLGTAYYFQGKRDKVREIYQTLRKLDPAMADKYFNELILP
jgi:tetratricopeptide (TPR) repeat protein